MATLNKHMIIGRVGRNPELKEFSNGSKLVVFSCATNESYKKKDGTYEEKTEWHDIKCFIPAYIDIIMKKVTAGDMLYIEGKIETESYTNKEGFEVRRKVTLLNAFQKLYVKMVKEGADFSDKTEKYPEPKDKTIATALEEDIDDDLPF